VSIKYTFTVEVTFNTDEFDDYIEAEAVAEGDLTTFNSGLRELYEGEWNLSDFNAEIENFVVTEPKLVRK